MNNDRNWPSSSRQAVHLKFAKEKFMTRGFPALAFLAVLSFACSAPVRAQMGMDLFKRPAIAKAFHPVVGKGSVYQDTGKDSKSRTSEISIVGKESVDGKEAFWMEFVSTESDGKTVMGKTLITPDDMQFHRIIFQQAGQQAMEMPAQMITAHRGNLQESANEWHSVGTESVTVPAGTFSCDHWHNDKTKGDIWTSDKVSPFGMVKSVNASGSTDVLVKILDDATDRITGPVKPFDMQQMMQEMQQHRQQGSQP
jgi:hypothetical protein